MTKLVSLLHVGMIVFSSVQAMNSKNGKIATSLIKENYHMTFKQKFKSKQGAIPQLFSFANVWLGYNALVDENKRYVHHNLSQSLLFSFAICPQDIRRKILTIMLDNDAESAQEFDEKPIFAAFVHYRSVQKLGPLKISNKIYSAGRLFRMSQKEMNDLKSISQPFFYIEQIIDAKTNIVSEKALKIIEIMPKNITQDLKIRVVDDEYLNGCWFGSLTMGAISFLAWPFLPYSVATGFTCCCQGLFSAFYYRQASLDARDVKL